MHSIVAQLRQELSFVSDPEKASQMAAYMKGQFRFFGVQSKQRKDITTRGKLNVGLVSPNTKCYFM